MHKTHRWLTGLVSVVVVMAAACGAARDPVAHPPGEGTPAYDTLSRLDVNRLAARLNLPLYWRWDDDRDGAIDPGEVHSLLFYPTTDSWIADGRFTDAFDAAYRSLLNESTSPAPSGADAERQRLVLAELDYGVATLVHTDLRTLTSSHHRFVEHMLRVASLIDALYARQTGMKAMADRVPTSDTAARSLLRRNWGIACQSPPQERNAACSALGGAPRQPIDAYPTDLQASDGFCARLESHASATTLLSPFTVVREQGSVLEPIPYTVAYASEMSAIATELRAAASAMDDPNERPLVTYLERAAAAFESNEWGPADEAWAQMNARNSSWYVRVGPDETYWDPCAHKAGFHLTFARINHDSLVWQDRLTPIQSAMEQSLASLVREHYRPRSVSFHMPDFIDIVINAGDDRDALGATIGQSLPNWGAVAEEGRGRTVVMSNLYTDPDSRARTRDKAASLLAAQAFAELSADSDSSLLSIILHEATHNLGPSHDYRARGMTGDEAFGGGMAAMLEELKAQSGALYFLSLLVERGVIDAATARRTQVDNLAWAFGHISRGMYTATGQRKAYSQLSAIQVGFLLDHGALRFDQNVLAADGSDRGAFVVDFEALPRASIELMTLVMEIKATADRARAESLAAQYVDGDRVPRALITERLMRFPRESFVYALDL